MSISKNNDKKDGYLLVPNAGDGSAAGEWLPHHVAILAISRREACDDGFQLSGRHTVCRQGCYRMIKTATVASSCLGSCISINSAGKQR
jgi:hypothetical protein